MNKITEKFVSSYILNYEYKFVLWIEKSKLKKIWKKRKEKRQSEFLNLFCASENSEKANILSKL